MMTHLVFLGIAKKDLEAAKCLLYQKLYSQSVFYLEQSIEKAVKSFAIWNEIITETEAKNTIGHEAWKIYYKIFNEFRNEFEKLDEKLEKILEQFPKLRDVSLIKELEIMLKNVLDKNKLDKYKEVFSKENIIQNIFLSREELKGIITEINEFKNIPKKKVMIKIKEKEIEDLKRKLYQLLDVLSEIKLINIEETKNALDKAITSGYINDFLKRIYQFIFDVSFCHLSLFYLSLVFSPHAIRSRYPENNFNPLEVYNDEMALIQMLEPFILITEEVLEKLSFCYSLKISFIEETQVEKETEDENDSIF